MEESTKSQRGGFRIGAGRPKGTTKPDKKKPFTFKLSVEEEKAVRELLARMRNKLILLFIILITGLSVNAMTLTGGVEERAQYAKEYAFKELPLKIDVKLLKPYSMDSNYDENMRILKGFAKAANRKVVKFDVAKSFLPYYGIIYKKNPKTEYIYNWGILLYVNVRDTDDVKHYPYKVAQYKPNGTLFAVATYISNDEQFFFNKKGQQVGHWIGGKYYDNKGNVKMSRTTLLEYED